MSVSTLESLNFSIKHRRVVINCSSYPTIYVNIKAESPLIDLTSRFKSLSYSFKNASFCSTIIFLSGFSVINMFKTPCTIKYQTPYEKQLVWIFSTSTIFSKLKNSLISFSFSSIQYEILYLSIQHMPMMYCWMTDSKGSECSNTVMRSFSFWVKWEYWETYLWRRVKILHVNLRDWRSFFMRFSGKRSLSRFPMKNEKNSAIPFTITLNLSNRSI